MTQSVRQPEILDRSRDNPAPASILLVEDEWQVARDLTARLENLNYRVEGPVSTGELAVEAALRTRPDLVLMDIRLRGEMDGITAAAHIGEQVGAPIVFLTAAYSAETFDRARNTAPYSYLIKPVDSDELRCAIELSLHRRRIELRLQERERDVERLNGRLERRVAERTADLEAANRELEAFSYSVAHDLRAPLRSIEGFTAVAIEDLDAGLWNDARKHLNSVRSAAHRMSKLIDDLLALARVVRTDCARTQLNVSTMAAEVGSELRAANPDRTVVFVNQEGVTAAADKTLLGVVLYNLLSNAWKFTARVAHARVEFGGTRTGAELLCFVRDNGIGFDPKQAGRLFEVFHRLHPEQAYPGNGIGLAIVERAVRRHGGRVWAEGEAGAGATFWFTIPDAFTPDGGEAL
jgi:signal transduction histidine kinase